MLLCTRMATFPHNIADIKFIFKNTHKNITSIWQKMPARKKPVTFQAYKKQVLTFPFVLVDQGE